MRALAIITDCGVDRSMATVIAGQQKDNVFWIRRNERSEETEGQTVYIDFEPQDQCASIVSRPDDVSPGGQWAKEQGWHYWVPKLITQVLQDRSWHNDAAPSFGWPEDEQQRLTLWVEHYLPEMREMDGKRFVVAWNPDGGGDVGAKGYETYETDDIGEALAKMLEWRMRLPAWVGLLESAEPKPAPKPVKKGPRFVALIGSVREEYPDVPEPTADLVCWDRQEGQPVFTLHRKYAQVTCLELAGQAGPEGFIRWLNGLSDDALKSEGITPDTTTWNDWEEFMEEVASQLRRMEMDARYEFAPGCISIPLEDGTEWAWGVMTGQWEGYIVRDDSLLSPRTTLTIPIEARDPLDVANRIYTRVMANHERGGAMPINTTTEPKAEPESNAGDNATCCPECSSCGPHYRSCSHYEE